MFTTGLGEKWLHLESRNQGSRRSTKRTINVEGTRVISGSGRKTIIWVHPFVGTTSEYWLTIVWLRSIPSWIGYPLGVPPKWLGFPVQVISTWMGTCNPHEARRGAQCGSPLTSTPEGSASKHGCFPRSPNQWDFLFKMLIFDQVVDFEANLSLKLNPKLISQITYAYGVLENHTTPGVALAPSSKAGLLRTRRRKTLGGCEAALRWIRRWSNSPQLQKATTLGKSCLTWDG